MKKIKFTLAPDTGHLSETDTKRYFSVLGFSVFAFVFAQSIASFAIDYAVARFAPWMLQNVILSVIINLLPIYAVGVPIFIILLRQLPSVEPLSQPLGAKGWLGGLCATIAMMTLGNYISQITILWFEAMMGRTIVNPVEQLTLSSPWWINLIFMAVLAPVIEELVFRRAVCRRLLPLGEGYAIILSAVIFGLCHRNFFQFFYALGVGLILALIYVKTGKLIHTISFHVIINLLGGVFAPWLLKKLDIEKLSEALNTVVESGYTDTAPLAPFAQPLMLLAVYEVVLYGGAIVGAVLLIRSYKKYPIDSGILPPPKEGKVGNIFMNAGVAAALAAFACAFALSLL